MLIFTPAYTMRSAHRIQSCEKRDREKERQTDTYDTKSLEAVNNKSITVIVMGKVKAAQEASALSVCVKGFMLLNRVNRSPC